MDKRPVKSVYIHPRRELHILFARNGQQDKIPHDGNGLIEMLASPSCSICSALYLGKKENP